MCTYIIPILGYGGTCQLPDLLPVHLGCTAIILGTGVCGGATMLAEKGGLKGGHSIGLQEQEEGHLKTSNLNSCNGQA